MKALIPIILAVATASCTVIHGDATKGTYTYASVGGDVEQYAQTPGGVTAGRIDNSKSFDRLNRTATNYLWANALENIVGSASNAWKSTQNAKTAAGVEKAKSADAVKTSEIEAGTRETEILNPTPTP